ncbi:hypothetical protein SAEN111111_20295 [Saccharibacillus endophyticus]
MGSIRIYVYFEIRPACRAEYRIERRSRSMYPVARMYEIGNEMHQPGETSPRQALQFCSEPNKDRDRREKRIVAPVSSLPFGPFGDSKRLFVLDGLVDPVQKASTIHKRSLMTWQRKNR